MKITLDDLIRWKQSSLEIARLLKFDNNILNFLNNNVLLKINSSRIPEGMWYGYATYDKKTPIIEIYSQNISCFSVEEIIFAFKSKGVPKKTLKKVQSLFELVEKKALFKVFNQSGMDHELIGHIYNNLAGKKHGEKEAIEIQLLFAKARAQLFPKLPWSIISELAPIILYHHKKDEF